MKILNTNTTPKEMVDYVFANGLDQDFLLAMMNHIGGYSIGEIADKKWVDEGEQVRLLSKSYDISVPIQDEEIVTAVKNGLYISAFVSRKEAARQVHFLVHQYPASMKAQFEEQITEEVVRYMVMKTVRALRLDSIEKILAYVHQ